MNRHDATGKARSLEKRLRAMYRKVEVKAVEGMAAFRCRKGGKGDLHMKYNGMPTGMRELGL